MGRMDCDGSDANRAQSAELLKLPGNYPELTKSTPDLTKSPPAHPQDGNETFKITKGSRPGLRVEADPDRVKHHLDQSEIGQS